MRKAFTASLLVFISCVGPEDPDHGLVENLPAIVNKSDAFIKAIELVKRNSEFLKIFGIYKSFKK